MRASEQAQLDAVIGTFDSREKNLRPAVHAFQMRGADIVVTVRPVAIRHPVVFPYTKGLPSRYVRSAISLHSPEQVTTARTHQRI
jgi:hypothetical protein